MHVVPAALQGALRAAAARKSRQCKPRLTLHNPTSPLPSPPTTLTGQALAATGGGRLQGPRHQLHLVPHLQNEMNAGTQSTCASWERRTGTSQRHMHHLVRQGLHASRTLACCDLRCESAIWSRAAS